MSKLTLRKYLLDRRVELYEQINELQIKVIHYAATDEDIVKLRIAEAEMETIREVIDICTSRHKF